MFTVNYLFQTIFKSKIYMIYTKKKIKDRNI